MKRFITNLTSFRLDGWSITSAGEGVAGLMTYILCDSCIISQSIINMPLPSIVHMIG